MVQQDLQLEHGLTVSLRTVERACTPFRQAVAAKVTVRLETPPGKQLQVDFVCRQITIDGSRSRSSCLSPSSATPTATMYAPSGMSSNPRSSLAWKVPSVTLTGCQSRCYWITP